MCVHIVCVECVLVSWQPHLREKKQRSCLRSTFYYTQWLEVTSIATSNTNLLCVYVEEGLTSLSLLCLRVSTEKTEWWKMGVLVHVLSAKQAPSSGGEWNCIGTAKYMQYLSYFMNDVKWHVAKGIVLLGCCKSDGKGDWKNLVHSWLWARVKEGRHKALSSG